MNSKENQTKPVIKPLPDGPYLVADLADLRDSTGDALPTRASMALCRCGGSSNKPFCDGTHKEIGFSGAQRADRTPDKLEDYGGNQVTIHDNRGICAHAGHCTERLPEVFKLRQEPWIDPNGAPAAEIIETVRSCPSGALSVSSEQGEPTPPQRNPSILATKNGPYVVSGGVLLDGVELGEGASQQRYTLCRCGESKNKPFCDGTHWDIKFDDGSG